MSETVEQVKEKQSIDLMLIAMNDLARYQSATPVINAVSSVFEAMVAEYIEKYPDQKDFKAPQKKPE